MNQMIASKGSAESSRVFELAAELFSVLATPMRLRVLSALCEREKSVNELLAEIDTTQPNLSQHLAVLYRTGVLAKRKEGAQVIYRVQSEKLSRCAAACAPRSRLSWTSPVQCPHQRACCTEPVR